MGYIIKDLSNHRQDYQVAFQSNANHPLAESMGCIKFEGMWIYYFDLDATFTLMCDLDLINDL